MALVRPVSQPTSLKSWVTVALSTAADGITGADVADIGGYQLCAIELSTLSTDAAYSIQASLVSTGPLKTVLDTTGAVLSLGSTVAGVTSGKIVTVDPAKFSGWRYMSLVSGTTAAPIANATGATATLYLSVTAALT